MSIEFPSTGGGAGGGGATQDLFKTVSVSGVGSVVADNPNDVLTFKPGNNITMYVSGATDTIYIDAQASGTTQDVFKTVRPPSGADVVADNANDILNFITNSNRLFISGVASSDTIVWDVVQNNITQLGTITSGAWSGTSLGANFVPNHDNLNGFVSNEHIDHTSIILNAGSGLGGGGDISSNRTFDIIGGTGIVSSPGSIYTDDSEIDHNSLNNTHNLTTDIDHNLITNTHNLTSDIDHDSLTNFVANEHINHTSVTLNAGSGLAGGGDISTDRTFNVVGGTGITVSSGSIYINDSEIDHNSLNNTHNLTTDIDHDQLTNFVSNEHINHTSVNLTGGSGLIGGGDISSSRVFDVVGGHGIISSPGSIYVNDSEIDHNSLNNYDADKHFLMSEITQVGVVTSGVWSGTALGATQVPNHDNLNGFVANEHINHTSVTLTAGSGLTGGGDISTSRTFNIGQGVGITVNADSISSNDSEINHDALSNFVANEHINHTSVNINTTSPLGGGGDISSTRTMQIGSLSSFGASNEVVGLKSDASSWEYKSILGSGNTTVVHSAGSIIVHSTGGASSVGSAFVTMNCPSGTNPVADAVDDTLNFLTDSNRLLISGNSTTDSIIFDVVQSNIDHDSLTNFVGNEHINHSSVTLTAGSGLSGGGDITTSRGFDIVGGTGITSSPGSIYTNDSEINHNNLNNYSANEHINHTSVTLTAGSGLSGGGDISSNRTFDVIGGTGIVSSPGSIYTNDSEIDHNSLANTHNLTTDIDHNQLTNYLSSEHFTQSAITTVGTITTGVWSGTPLGAGYVPNHDNLNGFVANEHIDWTNTSNNFNTTGSINDGVLTIYNGSISSAVHVKSTTGEFNNVGIGTVPGTDELTFPEGASVGTPGSLCFCVNGDYNGYNSNVFDFTTVGSLNAASGVQTFLKLSPTVNQSNTAGYTALGINTTIASSGTGSFRVLSFEVDGNSKLLVMKDSTSQWNDGAGDIMTWLPGSAALQITDGTTTYKYTAGNGIEVPTNKAAFIAQAATSAGLFFKAGASRFAFTNTAGTDIVTFDLTGEGYISGGVKLGADADSNWFDNSSHGTSSTTMYIGNQTINTSSDERIKKNITDTKVNALETLGKLRIVDFEWDDPTDKCENNRNMRGRWTGMIAQETVKVVPYIINAPRKNGEIDYESKERWFVDYNHLVPMLVKAIQELQEKIKELSKVK